MNESVDILLTTYNGEKYLDQQIRSIINQKFLHWRLIIRDDGSQDKSLLLITNYVQTYPEKIQLISDDLGQLGPTGSFDRLLQCSTAPYVAFCDQDDIWHPEKLLLLKGCIQRLEENHGVDTPILCHSDLEVVDERQVKVADSFWWYQNLNPVKMQKFERLLVQNCVTGCAMMVNKSLVNRASPIPKNAIMHDWWFALIAESLGVLEAVSDKTVQYRQHDCNDTGAKEWGFNFVLLSIFKRHRQYKKGFEKKRDQALALLESEMLDDVHNEIVSQFIYLFSCHWLVKRIIIIRKGFFMHGLIRNIALLIWI